MKLPQIERALNQVNNFSLLICWHMTLHNTSAMNQALKHRDHNTNLLTAMKYDREYVSLMQFCSQTIFSASLKEDWESYWFISVRYWLGRTWRKVYDMGWMRSVFSWTGLISWEKMLNPAPVTALMFHSSSPGTNKVQCHLQSPNPPGAKIKYGDRPDIHHVCLHGVIKHRDVGAMDKQGMIPSGMICPLGTQLPAHQINVLYAFWWCAMVDAGGSAGDGMCPSPLLELLITIPSKAVILYYETI